MTTAVEEHPTEPGERSGSGSAAHAPDTPLLAVRDLSVEFTLRGVRSTVVEDVSYSVGRGEFVGIIGETGSGKSVSLRAGLHALPRNARVLKGTRTFRGRDLTTMSAKELRGLRGAALGFIPQQPWSALNPVQRLERQFIAVGRSHGKSREWVRDAARRMLRRVEIGDPDRVLAGYSGELSGGMAQRVVIAISLMLEPELLVADEPTTALDLTVQREILDLLNDICREDGRSVLLVTHDLGVVSTYCDRVYVMRHGRMVEEGPVDEVFAHPREDYTRVLISAADDRIGEGGDDE